MHEARSVLRVVGGLLLSLPSRPPPVKLLKMILTNNLFYFIFIAQKLKVTRRCNRVVGRWCWLL